jgi:hypothetical protein
MTQQKQGHKTYRVISNMRNIFLIAMFSIVTLAEAKAGNSFSASQQFSSQRDRDSIKLASSSDGLCNGKFPGKAGSVWARYYKGASTRKNTVSIDLRVSPDVRSVLEDPLSGGRRQRVRSTLKMLSINGRAIDLSNVTESIGTPGFDVTFIMDDYKFEGSSSVRLLKGGEKIKAVISIHGSKPYGQQRGSAVTRVFQCTVPSSTADDPGQPKDMSTF